MNISGVRRVILLLGPTQVGKSSVANFLLNGTVDITTNKFHVGDGTKSCTGLPQCENFTQKVGGDFSIIDTAGVGDSDGNDTENMMALYKFLLQDNIEISCVAFVVRYPTLENEEYRNIIAFYKTMLAGAFGQNIIAIVSHAEVKNTKWVNKQLRVGKNPDKIIEGMVNSIRGSLGLDNLVSYALDTLASDNDVPEDYEHALDCRRRILEKCINSAGVSPSRLAFPKSIPWQKTDKENAKKLEHRCEIIEVELQKLDVEISSLTKDSTNCTECITSLNESIQSIVDNIETLDTDDLVVFTTQTFKLMWFFWTGVGFEHTADHKIGTVTHKNGILENLTIQEKRATGKIKGDHFKSLVTLEFWGYNREVHESDILRLREDENKKRKDKESNEEILRDIIAKIEQKQNEKRDRENEYLADLMKIETFNAKILALEQVRTYV